MIVALEQHTDWIMGLIDYLWATERNRVEAREEVQSAWVEHAREVAEATLMPRADSWYVGANIPGKKRVYMPYLAASIDIRRFARRSQPTATGASNSRTTAMVGLRLT